MEWEHTQSIHHPLPTYHTPPPMRSICPGKVVQVVSAPAIHKGTLKHAH